MLHLDRPITRRRMLELAGIAAGMGVLSACAQAPAPTPVPQPPATEVPAAATGAPSTETPSEAPTTEAGEAVPEFVAAYEDGQASYGWYDEMHLPKTQEILIWAPPGGEEDPWVKSLIDARERFKEKYPEITVTWEEIAWEDWQTKVMAAVAAKQGPDLIGETDNEAEFPRRHAIRDIPEEVLASDYIHKHKFYEVRPLDDGKLYWLMTSVMAPVLVVNRELLAKEGLKPSDVPTTWDEFARFCQQLTKFENGVMTQAGCDLNGQTQFLWQDMMYQRRAHLWDKEKALFNTEEGVFCWQTLVDMYDQFKICDTTFLPFDQGFGTGKAATIWVWTWFLGSMQVNYPDIDWVPVIYPVFPDKKLYGRFDYDGNWWMVTTIPDGDRMAAAWEYFKFHQHDYQYMVEHTHANGMFLAIEPHPDYNKTYDELTAKEKLSQAEGRSLAEAILYKQYKTGMIFSGECTGYMNDLLTKMSDAVLINKQPVKDALDEYEKVFNEFIANTNVWFTPEA